MSTQLRRVGQFGRVDGVDYAALPWVMRQIGIADADSAEVFSRFRVAEDELRQALNED